jgi:glutamyl-tRNA reductase
VSIVVVGLNHRTVPLAVLERMTVPPAGLPKALHHLTSGDHVAEAVVLSTCNRTEVYAVCETFHGALADINRFFVELSGLDQSAFAAHLTSAYDAGAVRHLFTVAAGLDSAVVGETEILGQVRGAFEAALSNAASGPHLSAMFRHALETGKRARTETAIARGTASVSHAAVELAVDRMGSLVGRSVLVLGTGEIGVSMVNALQHAGVGEVLVANRTRQKAAKLAQQVGGTAVALHELPTALAHVDVLLTATSSDTFVLEHDDVAAVMASRQGRHLLIVDTAMPRDVEPSAASIDGVTLLDLESIRSFVDRGLDSRRREIEAVQAIVAEESDRYEAGAAARLVAPIVVSLRTRTENMRADQLAKFDSRLAGLSPEHRDVVEALTKQLMAKFLHEPTVRLKQHAGTVRGNRMADAARLLFDLDDLDEPASDRAEEHVDEPRDSASADSSLSILDLLTPDR